MAQELGDCFRSAYKGVVDVTMAGQADGELTLVHGMVTNPWCDKAIHHAWVEIRNDPFVIVHDEVSDILMPRDGYYEHFKIAAEATRRYDAETAVILALQHQHFGPWD